jgi:D-methionine transport system permease protein
MLELFNLLAVALAQTLYMVLASSLLASVVGIPLGFILFTTQSHHILANGGLHKILGMVVNASRSIPFIILLVAILPLTRLLVGTSIGTNAAIVPLTIGAIPFIARIVENALQEVPHGLTESALALGAAPLQIMRKVLWPEALPSIINGLTVTVITLVGFSAMAGTVGGGGLGDVGIRYGYQRFDGTIMLATVVLLIIVVQGIQMLGNSFAKKVNKK